LRWRAVSAEALAWRDFDGQSVVRNAHTGSTHLFEAFSADILRTLVEAGDFLSAAQVAVRLAGEPAGAQEFEEWETAIQKVLSEFERLGLAEPQSV
jgi:PqqD family protein of HPr-rel-A system